MVNSMTQWLPKRCEGGKVFDRNDETLSALNFPDRDRANLQMAAGRKSNASRPQRHTPLWRPMKAA
jgi:hypothetical protein